MCSTEKVGAVSSSGTAATMRVYPELRRVHPELRRPPVVPRLVSHRELSHAAPFSTNRAKLNRQTPEIEHLATRRKQTAAICSNRQKINICFDENRSFNAFLSGTSSYIETAVTHSKQTIGEFLSGARTACIGTQDAFLTGSAPQTKIALTHSKQKRRIISNRF